jgi:hypothetical protein
VSTEQTNEHIKAHQGCPYDIYDIYDLDMLRLAEMASLFRTKWIQVVILIKIKMIKGKSPCQATFEHIDYWLQQLDQHGDEGVQRHGPAKLLQTDHYLVLLLPTTCPCKGTGWQQSRLERKSQGGQLRTCAVAWQ